MNKIIYTLLTIIIFSCISINANADDNEIVTYGNLDCATWIKDKGRDSLANKRWLVGFMSGQAIALNKNILKDVSTESIFLWMDNYCNSNPFEYVSFGGWVMSMVLQGGKGLNK